MRLVDLPKFALGTFAVRASRLEVSVDSMHTSSTTVVLAC